MELSYYHKAMIVAAVGIFYTHVPIYFYDKHGLTLIEAPKHWVLLFCLLSLPVLFRRMAAWNALKSPVTAWCMGYACLSVIWFFQSSQSDMTWHEVRFRFLAIIELFCFLAIFWDPGAVTLARKALVPAVLVGVALNIYEVFAPMSFSTVVGRSAGLYQNPNLSGEALVMGMIISATVLQPRYRGPFILLTGIGVFATFSRGSILGWVIAVAGLIFVCRVSLKDFLASGFVGLALGILLILPLWDQLLTTWERTGMLNVNVLQRLAWFTDPSGVSDPSSWERAYVAQRALEKIAEQPFLGGGTGSSAEAYVLPHNQYLSLMLDHGLFGAMILPLLVLAVIWGACGESRRVAIVFGCAIMELSFFTHAILYGPHSLILFSLMGAMTGTRNHRETERGEEMKIAVTARGFVRA